MQASSHGNGDARSVRHFRGYPGNKGSNGVFQTIINQIPPHDCFIEAFAGSGQIMRRIRPALSRIAIDSDPAVASLWEDCPGVTFICGDAVAWLESCIIPGRTVIYCDPPYLMSVRGGRRLYAHEFCQEDQHDRLLTVLRGFTVPVLLSGYSSPLYERRLADWRRLEYRVQTRGGTRQECLWCNFPEPHALHDYRFLGTNYREREKIGRMKKRWVNRLKILPRFVRLALLDAIFNEFLP